MCTPPRERSAGAPRAPFPTRPRAHTAAAARLVSAHDDNASKPNRQAIKDFGDVLYALAHAQHAHAHAHTRAHYRLCRETTGLGRDPDK